MIKCALHVFMKTIKKTITTITALHVVLYSMVGICRLC